MGKLKKSRTGTPSKRAIGAKLRTKGRKLNPWGGPNIPFRFKQVRFGGSRTKQAKPDLARLTKVNYLSSDVADWPVDTDLVTHQLNPKNRAPQASVDRMNASVEQAYHRAGYQ